MKVSELLFLLEAKQCRFRKGQDLLQWLWVSTSSGGNTRNKRGHRQSHYWYSGSINSLFLEISITLLQYSASNCNCWEMFPSHSCLFEKEKRNQCNTMTGWYLSGLALIFSHWGHPRHSQADRKYNRLLWQTDNDFKSIAHVGQYVTYNSLSIFYKYTDEQN